MAKIIEDDYTRKHLPNLLNLTFIPRYWHNTEEDFIWCDCVERPEYSRYIYYATLDNWRIE